MAFQRTAFLAAAFLFVQRHQNASGFGMKPPLLVRTQQRSLTSPSTTAIRAEPSASEKAAVLRQKAEEAKKKAEELKKVAERKAEAAMVAVKKANDKSAEKYDEEGTTAPKKPMRPVSNPEATTKASTRIVQDPSEGAIIPINSETIQFTSGVLGGALALSLGASPAFAVAAAAAANYISKKDNLGELNELIQALTKASLNTFNWFANLDSKYTILGNLSESLDNSINDFKNAKVENSETVKQIEATVSKTTKQIQQLVEEIDLIEGGRQALGAVGDVVETSIDKALDANEEYKLTERAAGAAKKALEKAKEGKD